MSMYHDACVESDAADPSYWGMCTCSWIGDIRENFDDAQIDVNEHRVAVLRSVEEDEK